jgi:hypothetical protein
MSSEAAKKAWETIRARKAGMEIPPRDMRGIRRRWNWTEHQSNRLHQVQEILEDLKDYKPLTLRQVYYQLVGQGHIDNNLSQYGSLSHLLKWARIEGLISWDDIEDRTRVFHDQTGWILEDFVTQSLDQFLTGYRHDLLWNQEKFVEIWIEKDALSRVAERVATNYTVSVIVNRGFASISFLHDYELRIAQHPNKSPVILYFGDFDPSGKAMLPATQKTLEDEMGVQGVEFKMIALTEEDIATYHLPHKPEAIKEKDPRTQRHIEQYGELAVELDALDVRVLEEKIRTAILEEIDSDLLNAERETETEESNLLSRLKDRTIEAIQNERTG